MDRTIKKCTCCGKNLAIEDVSYVGHQKDINLHLFNCKFCNSTVVIKPFVHLNKVFSTKGNVDSVVCTLPNEKKAKCSCGQISYSNSGLPFFMERKFMDFDSYYCGHSGWD